MTPDEELDDVVEWAWTDGISAIDAKDEQYAEVSAHVEMFLVLAEVLRMCEWSREELIGMLDECVFDVPPEPVARLH